MIILFRFHDHFDLTLHNLKILKHYNKNHIFIGFYGGNDSANLIPNDLRNEFDDLYIIPSEDPYWKWKNADLCVRQWYKDTGCKFDFDHVHLAEWDMLTLFDVQDHAPAKGSNSVTYKFSYDQASEDLNWSWIRDDYYEWDLFQRYFSQEFGFNNFNACDFGVVGGAYICREYLDKFSAIYPKSINNDEVRLGCFSKLWDIPIEDNGFYTIGGAYRTADDEIYDKFTRDYLMQGVEVGFKVLHPVRHKLELSEMQI